MLSRLRLALPGHSLPGHSLRRNSARRHRARRSAFTLLEVLIATAITLLMMLSLVQVFKIIGDSMKQGRAALQMNNTLRAVTFRLRNDLSNLTVRVDPPADQGSGGGYLEYFDGSMTDYTTGLFVGAESNRFGDLDDILMFTARAGDSWFTGQVPEKILTTASSNSNTPVTITSQLAEIAVFARPVVTAPGFPTQFQLHYRVLLIRPDLNTVPIAAFTYLPNISVTGTTSTDMTQVHQLCDLSVHRAFDGDSTTADPIVANSLEDLSKPENRFAHFQFRIAGTQAATMPLLVLDTTDYGLFGPATLPLLPFRDPVATGDLAGATGHFLDPAFVLADSRLGEDILATNVLAFDVKGYDSGATVIGTAGPDALPNPLLPSNVGADGSDDIILTPNDPGYASAIAAPHVVASTGSYVDLMWGRKALNSGALNSGGSFGSMFASELSGLTTGNAFSESLLRSGKVIPAFSVMQPTFDTWTTAYESNGTLEAESVASRGLLSHDGWLRMHGQSGNPLDLHENWRQLNGPHIDAGTDGIDNNGTGGVDEAAERETSPPFPVKLRGIKISVRIEDIATRQVKQMSVANEFVTQ